MIFRFYEQTKNKINYWAIDINSKEKKPQQTQIFMIKFFHYGFNFNFKSTCYIMSLRHQHLQKCRKVW